VKQAVKGDSKIQEKKIAHHECSKGLNGDDNSMLMMIALPQA